MELSSHDIFLHRVFQYTGIVLVVAIAGGGYWYWQHARAAQIVTDNRPSFEAPLTTSLDLTRGVGVATYSRADGADRRATVTDFEGLIRPVKQNEARFEGARRVENLNPKSEADSGWTAGGTTPPTVNTSVSYGGKTAVSVTLPTGVNGYSASRATGSNFSVKLNSKYITSYQIAADRALTGSESVTVYITGVVGMNTVTFSTSKQLTTNWVRYASSVSTNSSGDGTDYFTVFPASNLSTPITIYFTERQVEEVTGQANQNPSEYVSTNVKTAFPYHGAGVDGVKYFDTQNGNTVASNVVTEATGAKIASSTLKGYLAEGSRENIVLRSEEIDNASWHKTDASVTANDTTAPDGRMTAEKLTTSTASNPNAYTADATASAARYTASVWIKAGNITEAAIQLYQNGQGGVNQSAVILSGPGTISGNGTQIITISDLSTTEWTRVATTSDANVVGSANINFYVKNRLSGSTIGDYNYFWGTQLEQASFASSYIPTTSASVTRAADNLRYPETGNFNDPAGTVFVDVITEWSGGSGFSAMWVADSTNTQKLSLWHWSGSSNHIAVDRSGGGGTRNNADYSGAAITSGTPMKLAQRWTSAANSLFRDGSLRVSDTTLTLPYDALNNNLYIGRQVGNGYEAYSTIKNVRIWKKALSDTELQNLTSTTEGIANSATQKTAIKAPSNTGLVGYWSFEDGSGTKAEDFSPTNSNTGTLTNGPTWVDGKIGKALSFDGADDYISTTFDAPTSSFSVSALVKTNNTASADSRRAIISKRTSLSEWHFSQNTSTSKLIFDAWDASSNTTKSFSGATALQPNVWYHAVLTYDGSMASIYLNGILDGSTSSGNAMRDTSDYVRIGTEILDPDRYWSGSIDEVRLYDYALSATEIAGLYAQGSAAKTIVNAGQNSQITDGLVGLWSFNGPDLSGTTAYDRSGQGNNGTLTNGPSVYPGKVGQALSFDGTDDYVTLGQPTILNNLTAPMTVSAWVKPSAFPSAGNYMTIVGKMYDWQLEVHDNGGVMFRRWSAYQSSGGTPAALGTGIWSHVAVTLSTDGSNNCLIYVNGVLNSTGTIATPLNTNTANTKISGYIQSDINYFAGPIDEVRLYDRALSAAEIATLYNMSR